MKTLNRTTCGIISSALLSAGLTKAAQRLDPLTRSVAKTERTVFAPEAPANSCTNPCFYNRA